MKLNNEILFKVLSLLAEGYDMEFHKDRYILVENPDAKPWDNPNYVIDLEEARELLLGRTKSAYTSLLLEKSNS